MDLYVHQTSSIQLRLPAGKFLFLLFLKDEAAEYLRSGKYLWEARVAKTF